MNSYSFISTHVFLNKIVVDLFIFLKFIKTFVKKNILSFNSFTLAAFKMSGDIKTSGKFFKNSDWIISKIKKDLSVLN